MRPYFISAGLALAITGAHAQETPPTTPLAPPPAPTIAPAPSDEPETSLETLITRALENSPRLQIARENLAAAQARQGAARSFAGPTLQLVPGFSGSREARDEEVIVAQPLDVFGLRRARAQVGAAETRRAQAESSLAVRALTIEVKNAAALLFAAQENENLEQVQLEVAQRFREAAAKRAALGDVPGVQVQRAELELLRTQNDLAKAHAHRSSRRVALNLLMGAAPDDRLKVALPLDAAATASLRASTLPLPVPPPASESATPATSATVGGELVAPDAGISPSRPDLASARATLDLREAQVRALKRQSLPSVELQARRSAFFGRDGSTALRAVVTVPLFDFGALKGERRAAQASARAQQATLRLLNQQAAAQLESARAQLQSRRETATRYREQLLPLTLDLLRKTQIGYAQGASTYLEVLEAQRTLRQIQTEYLQALVGIQTGETALDAALNGGALPLEPSFPSREAAFNESQ